MSPDGDGPAGGDGNDDGAGDGRLVAIAAVHPSQLYVDAARLRELWEWFDVAAPSYDPIPVFAPGRFDTDCPVLADGHTRALAAVVAGHDRLRVRAVTDAEREAWPLGVYETCVGWCVEAGVTRPRDLVGRVVTRERFLRAWTRRCHGLEAHPGDPADVTLPDGGASG
jgi:hypothetical protein